MKKNIIFITGGKGSGKTTAAVTYTRPSKIDGVLVVDSEDSTSDIYDKMKKEGGKIFDLLRIQGRYSGETVLSQIATGNLPWVTESQKNSLAGLWNWLINKINQATVEKKYHTLIFDTVEPLEAAATAWASINKNKSGWSGDMTYGRFETEAVRPLLEGFMESLTARGIENIILTSHIKNTWLDKKPVPGKIEPGGRLALWSRVSSAMYWLVRPARPTNAAGAPSAVVLKARNEEIGGGEDDEWDVKSLIPARVPCFTWRNLRAYEKDGYDPLNPAEGETLYPDEIGMISELLTDAQMRLMIVGAQVELEQAKAQNQPLLSVPAPAAPIASGEEEAKRLKAVEPALTAEEIAEIIGRPVPLVKRWIS